MNATQQKIIDAALQLFAKKGIRSTEIDAIAVSAGISRKVILTYFANKEQILECCVSSEIEKYRQHISLVNTMDQPAVEKLRAVYRYGFHLAPVFHPIFMFTLQKYYPAINAQCLQFEEELFMHHIAALISKGYQNKELRTDLDINLAVRLQHVCFNALFQQHNKLVAEFGREKVLEGFVRQLVDVLKKAI